MQAGDGCPSYDEPAALVVEQTRVIAALRDDSLPPYNGYPDARHQLCEAHLAREVIPRAPGRNLLERGLNALDAIRRAFTGHLWTPPIALPD